MSIEIGSKWVKDGEVVEVVDVVVINYEDHVINLILYASKKDTERVGFLRIDKIHTLTERDFLEQYKPYEPVYEYKWVQIRNNYAYETDGYYIDFSEIASKETDFWNAFNTYTYRLIETKRERKQ